MLEDAIRYPLNSDDRLATLVIGGALFLLSFLILPIFVVQGYLVRVLRSTVEGDDAAPSFTDWGELFVDGLKLVAVSLVYGIAVSIPFVVAAVVVGLGGLTGSDAGFAAFGIVGVLLFLLATLVAILVSYLLPAAITNFAVEGRMGAAFDLGTIREAAFSGKYLIGVLLGVVLNGIIGTVAGPFAVVLIGFPMLFYGQVVSYYCFARGFAESTGGGRTADPATTRVDRSETDTL